MKKNLYTCICIFLALLTIVPARAATHLITVADYQFSPDTMTVNNGDTITWQWESGFHTTTSNGIPAGAVPWNELIDSLHTTFTYVVTVAGTYHYISIPDLPGMTGKFTLPGPVGIDPLFIASYSLDLVSNPVHNNLTISYHLPFNSPVDIALYALSGMRVQTLLQQTKNSGEYKESFFIGENFPGGMYLLVMQTGNILLTRKLLIQ